jgi:cytochrome c-type biogenesis protein
MGATVSLSDFRGEVVLLNVWATWCTPCRWETPFLQTLHEAHAPRGLTLLGLSVDAAGAREQVRSFTEEEGVGYRILLDPEQSVMDAYGVLGLPATFLIDREGNIRFLRYGPVSEDDPSFMESLEAQLSLGL